MKRYLPFHSLYQIQHTRRGSYPFILCTRLNAHKEVLTLSFSVPLNTHKQVLTPCISVYPFLLCTKLNTHKGVLTLSFSVPNATLEEILYTHSFSTYPFLLCTKFIHAKRQLPIHPLCRTQHVKRYLYPFIHFAIIITLFSTYLFLFCTKLNTHKQVLTHSFSVPNATCEEALMLSHSLCQTQHTQRCTYPLILCTKLSTHD